MASASPPSPPLQDNVDSQLRSHRADLATPARGPRRHQPLHRMTSLPATTMATMMTFTGFLRRPTRTLRLPSSPPRMWMMMKMVGFLFRMAPFCHRLTRCVRKGPNCASRCGKQTVFLNGFTCKNPANVSASDFKTSNLNHVGNTDNFYRSSVTIVTAADFPGLNTLGLSIARTDLDVDGLVMAHSHPRASEMLFVNKGVVIVGFIDTGSKVFQKLLKEGDVFVFPRGLLHYCFNVGYDLATMFSVFNSQNPGMVSVADAMFEQLDSDLKDKLVRRLISLPGPKG